MSYYKKSSLTLAMLAAFTILPSSILGEQLLKPVSAQSAPTTNMAPALPSGSQIKIDGSSSLKTINQNLKDRFQKNFAGTQIETGEKGTDEALKALEAGTINLAAIGRPLTNAEERQGLKQVPISRHKIAIIISPNNPFKGDITLEQFAKIFRGEIKNWSEVGGAAGEIQVIDRPETSDTRRSFNSYPVFQSAPLKTGSNGVILTEDDTEVVVQKLGDNGIGYAIADQVRDRTDVKIVPMHKTLPTDPRYPFSQPLAYAYKGPNPSPEVKAFLCYANTSDYAKEGAIVSTEFCEEKTVAAETTVPMNNAPVASAPTAEPVTPPADSFPNWLGWLLLPVAGFAGWWFLGRGTGAAPVVPPVAAPVVPPAIAKPSRLILTPRDCQNAYAYWEVPSDRLAELRDQGGQKLALRLYDVTDTPNPTVFETFNADANEQDLHLPIGRDDRDYKAELGYLKSDGEWLSIATADSRVIASYLLQKIQTKREKYSVKKKQSSKRRKGYYLKKVSE
jgi:phosphate transport system substrate-binding protein